MRWRGNDEQDRMGVVLRDDVVLRRVDYGVDYLSEQGRPETHVLHLQCSHVQGLGRGAMEQFSGHHERLFSCFIFKTDRRSHTGPLEMNEEQSIGWNLSQIYFLNAMIHQPSKRDHKAHCVEMAIQWWAEYEGG